ITRPPLTYAQKTQGLLVSVCGMDISTSLEMLTMMTVELLEMLTMMTVELLEMLTMMTVDLLEMLTMMTGLIGDANNDMELQKKKSDPDWKEHPDEENLESDLGKDRVRDLKDKKKLCPLSGCGCRVNKLKKHYRQKHKMSAEEANNVYQELKTGDKL
ncbi:hypothetical protein CAPTEDRAFT_190046, partial [Capitella teleta]